MISDNDCQNCRVPLFLDKIRNFRPQHWCSQRDLWHFFNTPNNPIRSVFPLSMPYDAGDYRPDAAEMPIVPISTPIPAVYGTATRKPIMTCPSNHVETSSFSIRAMTREEVGIAVDWAAAEGWNPGRFDAEAFYATDPKGFLIAEKAGEPVGCGKRGIARAAHIKAAQQFGSDSSHGNSLQAPLSQPCPCPAAR